MRPRLLLPLLVLVLLPLLALAWLLGTEAGLRFAWERAQAWAPLALRAEAVRGRLVGPLELEGLRLTSEGMELEAARAVLDWHPGALLHGTLKLNPVELTALRITLAPTAQAEPERSAPPEPPSLPLDLELMLQVNGFTLLRPGAEPLHLVGFDLHGRLDLDRLTLETLGIDHPLGSLRLAGAAGLRPDAPLQLELDWRLLPPGPTVPLHGGGVVNGTLGEPRLELWVSAPFSARAQGSVAWLGQPLSWQAWLDLQPLRLDRLNPAWPPLQLGGTAEGRGQGGDLSLETALTLDGPETGPWDGRLALARRDGRWQLPELRLARVDGPARVSGQGAIQADDSVRLELSWQELVWPLQGEPALRSPHGQVWVGGHLDAYRLAGSGVLDRAGLPRGALAVVGEGDRSGLRIQRAEAAWLEGKMEAGGRLSWAPQPAWELRVQAAGVNPGALLPGWPGSVDVALNTQGSLGEAGLTATLELERLGGRLRGHPLEGRARAQWREGALLLPELELGSGSARLGASGRLDQSWDLSWSLRAPRLEHLAPELAGRLSAQGSLAGPMELPHLRLSAQGGELAWQGRRVGRLDLNADLDLSGQRPWDARLEAGAVQAAADAPVIDRLLLSAGGGPRRHTLALELAAMGAHWRQQALGHYRDGRWRAELHDGRLDTARLGRWQQTAPAKVQLGPEGAALEPWCWDQDGGGLCAQGRGGPAEGWHGAVRVSGFPVAALNPWLPRRDLGLTGRLDGEAGIDWSDAPRLTANLVASDGAFRFTLREDEVLESAYQRLSLSVDGDARGLNATTELSLKSGDYLRAQARLPGWQPGTPLAPDQPLSGQAEASLRELVWISLLVPEVVVPDGRLAMDLALSGTLARPQIEGSAVLEGGSVAVPLLGISLSEIRLQARGDAQARVLLNGSARSGEGTVALEGAVTDGAQGWQLALAIRGERFQVLHLPQARVIASPDLTLRIVPGQVRLGGSLTIPEAEIDLSDLSAPAQASPDVVIVDAPGEEAQGGLRWQVAAEVEVRFGEQVRLEGFGFTGRLGGRITIIEGLRGGALGRGELQILDGKYEAFGQKLTIAQGRLIYASMPLDNPAIEFRAVRQVEDVLVGVLATGRLKSPEVELYSEPRMDNSEVLAYLVLGRAFGDASQEEANILQQAAMSLGLAGGTRLARDIATEFGVDVVHVETSTQRSEASLVLGKYLSPKLYIQYAVGLWEAANTLRVRYRLSEHWTLEAESGTKAGADILYTIEQ